MGQHCGRAIIPGRVAVAALILVLMTGGAQARMRGAPGSFENMQAFTKVSRFAEREANAEVWLGKTKNVTETMQILAAIDRRVAQKIDVPWSKIARAWKAYFTKVQVVRFKARIPGEIPIRIYELLLVSMQLSPILLAA